MNKTTLGDDTSYACNDKLAFLTLDEAEGAAAYARWRYAPTEARLVPYRCSDCERYHLARKYPDDY